MGIETASTTRPKLPPAWFTHLFWRGHRWAHRFLGDRALWTPASRKGWGTMCLTATGRRSGESRTVIVGYVEDGPTPVVLAMNGWDEGHPAWWLNLEFDRNAVIRLKGEPKRPVRARLVEGEERERLWARWAAVDEDLDGYASLRSVETPVVVFEPRATDWRPPA